MIWTAEKQGVLKPGMEIIEPTNGNIGWQWKFEVSEQKFRGISEVKRNDNTEFIY